LNGCDKEDDDKDDDDKDDDDKDDDDKDDDDNDDDDNDDDDDDNDKDDGDKDGVNIMPVFFLVFVDDFIFRITTSLEGRVRTGRGGGGRYFTRIMFERFNICGGRKLICSVKKINVIFCR